MTVINCPYPLSARTKATLRPTMPALHIVSILREILFKCCSKTYPTITMLSLEFNDAMTRMRDIGSGNAKCRKIC